MDRYEKALREIAAGRIHDDGSAASPKGADNEGIKRLRNIAIDALKAGPGPLTTSPDGQQVGRWIQGFPDSGIRSVALTVESFVAALLRNIEETKAYLGDGEAYDEVTFKAFAYLGLAVEKAFTEASPARSNLEPPPGTLAQQESPSREEADS